jgi:uncharacterized protein (DUF1684 family)/ribosomal protein S18 acetylase RimI-like enzyme
MITAIDTVTVREARPDEFDAVGRLTAQGFGQNAVEVEKDPGERSARLNFLLDAADRAAEGTLLVAFRGEGDGATLVGTVTLYPPGSENARQARGNEAEVRLLAVAPEERGRGTGTLLMEEAARIARGWGTDALVLDTGPQSQRAQRLYERLGYERDLDREYQRSGDGRWLRVFRLPFEQPDRYAALVHRWRREHEAWRTTPDGFFALTAVHWLTEGAQQIPDLPGTWTTRGADVQVALPEGVGLVVDGVEHDGTYRFGEIHASKGVLARLDGRLLEIANRSGRALLRVRDAQSSLLTSYTHTPAYEPDPSWRIPGRLVPWEDGVRVIDLAATVPDVTHRLLSPGRLVFWRNGGWHQLLALQWGADATDLFILFGDETNAAETWADRRLLVPIPRIDGRVIIDFNFAVNLPCRYTEFGTCPTAPSENRLALAVTAGERRYPVPGTPTAA